MKTSDRREGAEITDGNDYSGYPLCGDKPMFAIHNCYCGNRTFYGTDLSNDDHYCCVSPYPSGQEQCKYTGPPPSWAFDPDDIRNSDVICQKGQVKNKNERREDAELYDPDNLRCIGDGFNFADDFTGLALDTKLGKDHGYCLKINNDQVYDSISRNDEVRVIGTNQPTVNYVGLVKCYNSEYGSDGILCGDRYRPIQYWCIGTADLCNTGDNIISIDHPELCRNRTYWRINNFSCDQSGELTYAVGSRCSGDYQHCTWPWYRDHLSRTFYPTCDDKSDQVFVINTTCRQYNQQFLGTYRTLWCSGNTSRWQGRICDNMYEWFAQQEDEKILDPHGCQRSCSTAGPDCVACEHEDFSQANSTGFCINKDLVCDGHPHPSCGGDDEGIDHCLDVYFKNRMVKR